MNNISFNTKDHNIVKIAREAKLGGIITKLNYRVFGLKQDNDTPIVIYYSKKDIGIQSRLSEVNHFFLKQGINTYISTDNKREKGEVRIGLRLDMRGHIGLSVAIIQTIIYCLEGRMAISKSNVVLKKLKITR